MRLGGWIGLGVMLIAPLLGSSASAQLVYNSVQRAETFVPLVGGANITLYGGNDDGHALIPIGFPFIFYGTSYEYVTVGVNGALNFVIPCSQGCAFDETCTFASVCSRAPLEPYPFDPPGFPSPATPNRVVAAFWDDLAFETVAPPTTSMLYVSRGTAPNRELIVEWRDIRRFTFSGPSTSRVSFQIRLIESTGSIELAYGPAQSGTGTWSGFIGVENAGGSIAHSPISCGSFSPGCGFASLAGLANQVFEIFVPQLPELVGNLAPTTGAEPGSSFAVEIGAENLGSQATTSGFTSELYLSTDITVTAADTLVGSARFAPGIIPTGAATRILTATVPAGLSPGFYRIGVLTDTLGEVAEINESNNTTVWNQTFLVGADLAVRAHDLGVAAPGVSTALSIELLNAGSAQTGVEWSVFLSTDRVFDAQDVLLAQGSTDVPAAPSTLVSFNAVIPALTPGQYYLIARVDPNDLIAEADEANNSSTSRALTLGPDLQITVGGPNTIGTSGQGVFELGIRSVAAPVGATDWALYFSSDTALDASDVLLAQGNAVLGPTQDLAFSITATIGALPSQSFHAIAVVDPADSIEEANENNNIAVDNTPTQVRGPDLVAVALRGAPRAFLGQSYAVDLEIRNQGGAAARDFYYSVHLSNNAAITINDPLLIELGPVSLEPSESLAATVVVQIPGTLPSGAYYLGLIVDWTTAIAEDDETNNIIFHPPFPDAIEVGGPAPDFTASMISVPPIGAAGELTTVQRWLDNAGNAAGTLAYRVHLSRSPTLDASSLPVSSGILALDALESDRAFDTFRIPSSLDPGQYKVIYELDPLGAVMELDEANNIISSAGLITVEPGALSVVTRNLPVAVVGHSYEVAIGARGGSGVYVWSIVSGALPSGIELDSSGSLRGIATELGSFDFRVLVNDGQSTAERTLKLLVSEPTETLEITTRAIPPIWVGRDFAYPLTVQGGVPPYVFTVDPALPEGLGLDEQGWIRGQGGQPSNQVHSFRVTDETGASHDRPIPVRVINPNDALRFDIGTLPDGVLGRPYEGRLRSINGVSPYRYELVFGELPPGLSLVDDELVGVPETVGIFVFSLRVSDSRSDFDLNSFVVTIEPADQVNILTLTLPPARVDAPYQEEDGAVVRIRAVAGTGTGTVGFAMLQGGLPPGLRLEADGSIQGTPELAGLFSFSVLAVDEFGAKNTRALGIAVDETESIVEPPAAEGCNCRTTASPNAGGGWFLGLMLLGLMLLRRRGLIVLAALLFVEPAFAQTTYYVDEETRPYTPLVNGTLVSFTNNDDGQATLVLPFGFQFFEHVYAELTVGTNGYVTFARSGSEYANSTTPTPGGPNDLIALFWDDLEVSLDSVSYTTSGSAPARVFTVEYSGVHRFQAVGASFSMQLRLYEGRSGRFEIHFGPAFGVTGSDPMNGTVGFENATGSEGLSFDPCSPTCSGQDLLGFEDRVFIARKDGGPDVLAVGVSGPARAVHDVPFSIQSQVRSEHAAGLGPFEVTVHLLRPFELLPNRPISSQPISLLPFEDRALMDSVVLSSTITPGSYRLLLVVDGGQSIAEPDESNNQVIASVPIEVEARRPDLVAQAISVGVASAQPNEEIEVEATLANLGLMTSTSTWTILLSDNRVLSRDDRVLYSELRSLSPGETSSVTWTVRLPSSIPGGRYHIGLFADLEESIPESNELNNQLTASGELRVGVSTLAVTTPTLPGAFVDTDYLAYLDATGGDGTYAWSLQAGTLPDGLSLLSTAGEIRGRPSSTGSFDFTVLVSSNGLTATRSFSIDVVEIDDHLAFVTRNLLPATIGEAYPPQPNLPEADRQRIRVIGGVGPVEQTLISVPPPGLELDKDGYLHGTPMSPGVFDLELRASDGVDTITQSIPLTVLIPGRLGLIAANLPDAVLDREYRYPLQVLGATASATISFNVVGGASVLPFGLALTRTGLLVGVPEQVGTWRFVVEVTEGEGVLAPTDTASFVLTVQPDDGFLITPSTLPIATIGKPYEARLEAVRGRPPFSWRLVGELSLAPGLRVSIDDRDGREAFVFSGTPEAVAVGTDRAGGVVSFFIKVEDAQGRHAEQPMSLRVVARQAEPDPGPTSSSGCAALAPDSGGLLFVILGLMWVFQHRRRVRVR